MNVYVNSCMASADGTVRPPAAARNWSTNAMVLTAYAAVTSDRLSAP